jgi:hypothetical protein
MVMLHSPQIPEDLSAKKQDKVHPVSALYDKTKEFINMFIGSKHPNTICWLLEIVNLLTDKFTVLDTTGGENKDFEKKKEALFPIYQRLLQSCR